MKRDSYSDQQAHASFQPQSSQSAIEPSQLGQPVHHSSSTSDVGAKWLSKASGWMADKLQTAQNFVNDSGGTIAPDQILPALKGTVKPALSQADRTNQPLVGVIDAGFGTNEHGSKMVEAIQKENPQAKIWQGGGVGTGSGLESLTEFVDVAKATGQRAVANLSFDLTEVHPDGSSSTRAQLTAKEQSALSYARDNGVLVVASSGNQGGAMSALGQASQPSDNLIVVGAANGNDRASYSSYGNGLDLVADVGAAGTSSAAAKVTGTIAKLWNTNPGLNSQQVEQMLTTTATDLKTPGWDAETGAGLLNSGAAIALATHTAPEAIVFSGAQLIQQVPGSLGGATWESRNGAVASERSAGFGDWLKDNAHGVLDVAGFIPVVGAVADVANAGLYAVEGDHANAALSAVAAVPGIGDAAAAVKLANRGVQAVQAANRETRALVPSRFRPSSPPSRPPTSPTSTGDAALKQIGALAQAKQKTLVHAANPSLITGGIQGAKLGMRIGAPTQANKKAPNNGFDNEFRRLARDYQLDPRKGLWDTLGDVVSKSTRLDDRKYLPGLDHPVGHFIQDYDVGSGKFLWEGGASLVSLASNPAVQSLNPLTPGTALTNFTLRPKETTQAFKDMGAGFVSLVSNPAVQSLSPPAALINFTLRPQETNQAYKDMGESIIKPYADAIKSGHPAEALGRLAGEIGTLVLPGGEAGAGAARAASIAAAAAKANRLAVAAAKARKLGEIFGRRDAALPSKPPVGSQITPKPTEMPVPLRATQSPRPDLLPETPPRAGGTPSGSRTQPSQEASTSRSTAGNRDREPVAAGGGNGGTRPSSPSTAAATPSATTRNQNSRADSAPAPRSGGSGNSNQPPQDPPTGGGGSPSFSGSENDPNQPSVPGNTSGTPRPNQFNDRRMTIDDLQERHPNLTRDHISLIQEGGINPQSVDFLLSQGLEPDNVSLLASLYKSDGVELAKSLLEHGRSREEVINLIEQSNNGKKNLDVLSQRFREYSGEQKPFRLGEPKDPGNMHEIVQAIDFGRRRGGTFEFDKQKGQGIDGFHRESSDPNEPSVPVSLKVFVKPNAETVEKQAKEILGSVNENAKQVRTAEVNGRKIGNGNAELFAYVKLSKGELEDYLQNTATSSSERSYAETFKRATFICKNGEELVLDQDRLKDLLDKAND